MKKIFKWVGIILGCLIVIGFLGFLYFIPPFTLAPPEAFSAPPAMAQPSLDGIKDPAQRLMAERGKYIVLRTGCTECHTPQGENGPMWDQYLAGGIKLNSKTGGTVISRNLTSDPQTGLARRTDAQVLRVLRSGVLSDGRVVNHRAMPWSAFSNWSEEDRYAVLMFLRNVKPFKHEIPDPSQEVVSGKPTEDEFFVVGDYAKH